MSDELKTIQAIQQELKAQGFKTKRFGKPAVKLKVTQSKKAESIISLKGAILHLFTFSEGILANREYFGGYDLDIDLNEPKSIELLIKKLHAIPVQHPRETEIALNVCHELGLQARVNDDGNVYCTGKCEKKVFNRLLNKRMKEYERQCLYDMNSR